MQQKAARAKAGATIRKLIFFIGFSSMVSTGRVCPMEQALVRASSRKALCLTGADRSSTTRVPLSVVAPAHVELKIVETDPGLRGDTATGGGKPAKLRLVLEKLKNRSLLVDTKPPKIAWGAASAAARPIRGRSRCAGNAGRSTKDDGRRLGHRAVADEGAAFPRERHLGTNFDIEGRVRSGVTPRRCLKITWTTRSPMQCSKARTVATD